MNKNGAIIIFEDDIYDKEMFSDVFKELNYKNKILFFNDG